MYYKINTIKSSIICYLLILSSFLGFSQEDDLLGELDEVTKDQVTFELPAFKTLKIGNMQSTKIADKGDLYLIVSHRFGALEDGLDTFFGLDEANTRIELLYSFWDGIQFSISRESFNRTFAAAAKVRFAKQSSKFPFNIAGYTAINRNTLLNTTTYPTLKDADKYSYVIQGLISRRFSKNFSFEIAPTYVRQNFQDLNEVKEANFNQIAFGFGGRYKLSKRVSFNAEYIHNFNRSSESIYTNPYTFGIDIETGGHVFQLLFTNAQSTNEPGFISKAIGDIAFGFNVVRVF